MKTLQEGRDALRWCLEHLCVPDLSRRQRRVTLQEIVKILRQHRRAAA